MCNLKPTGQHYSTFTNIYIVDIFIKNESHCIGMVDDESRILVRCQNIYLVKFNTKLTMFVHIMEYFSELYTNHRRSFESQVFQDLCCLPGICKTIIYLYTIRLYLFTISLMEGKEIQKHAGTTSVS